MSPDSPPAVRRFSPRLSLPALALLLLATGCGGGAPEADSAVPTPSPERAATAAGAESAAPASAQTRVERAAQRAREQLDRLEAVVDRLTPEQRLDLDEPIAELERRRDEALAAVAGEDVRPAKQRKAARELAKIADEAVELAGRARALAEGG